MAKNSKPILSVLIEEDKRTKFADLARRHSLSMGWLVNQAIDRMLEADSIDIYRDSIERVTAGIPIESLVPASIDNTDIEKLVSKSIDNYLQNKSVGFTHQEVRDIAAATIKDSIAFERLCNETAVVSVAEKIVKSALKPLSQAIAKLEADIQSIGASRTKTPAIPRKENPKADSFPDWVTKDDKRFYSLLAGNSELLDKVADAIGLSANNTELGASLAVLGVHKQDGTAFKDECSRIKKVVSHLKTTPESTLPLFPQ